MKLTNQAVKICRKENEMRKEPVILGNFREMTKTLNENEFQKAFENARYYGLDGSITPFAIGGSDIAAIYGESPWTTPLDLYYSKTKKKIAIKQDENSEAKQTGNRAEEYVMGLYEIITGNNARPNYDQARHPDPKYCHCVANVDGFVYDNNLGQRGLYEGKTTSTLRFDAIKEWKKGIIPRYYDLQVRFYMEIWDIDFTDVCCAWGLRPSEAAVVRVERDRALGEAILEDAEMFVEMALMGREPSLSSVKNSELVHKSITRIYGHANPKKPTVKFGKDMEETIKSIMEIDKQIKVIKEKRNMADKEIRDQEKIRTSLLAPIVTKLKTATRGELITNGETYEIIYEAPNRLLLNKELLQTKYPEIYEEVYEPSQNRTVTIFKK